MRSATQAWGWKWLDVGHRRSWPYFVTRLLNDVGNYGIRGTVRERVVKGLWFWFRNCIWWRSGIHKLYALARFAAYRRGLAFRPWELCYAQTARCRCGAGLAYWPPGWHLRRGRIEESNGWVCADLLTGRIKIERGEIEDKSLGVFGLQKETPEPPHEYYPFMFYEIRSENQPNRNGVMKKHLFGLLGEWYASCRDIGDSTRFGRGVPR